MSGLGPARVQPPLSLARQPYPFVLDTNVLLKDIIHVVKSGELSALLAAADLRAVRLFVAYHVPAEVDEHLGRFATVHGVDRDRAVEVWRDNYPDRLRVVQVPLKQIEDERLLAVSARDKDDIPTAALGVLLAPAVVLSEDRHLVDPGIAEREWLTIALNAASQGRADAMVHGASLITSLAVNLTGEGIKTLVRYLGPLPRGVVRFLLGVLGVGVVVHSISEGGRNRRRQRVAATARVATPILQALVESMSASQQAAEVIRGVLLQSGPETPLLLRVARAVAVLPEPGSAAEIARALREAGAASGRGLETTIRTELRASPMFREVVRGRWELGAKLRGDLRS